MTYLAITSLQNLITPPGKAIKIDRTRSLIELRL
jgi:hypothetical protein